MAKSTPKKLRKMPVNYLKLTPRETEVLLLITREYSPTEISKRLKIVDKTFYNHRANILVKIGVKGNVGLIKYMCKHGILNL
jgi:DNA-binding CsgD family transcriptional regulator